jgi:uncharacterized lipoprotein
MFSQVVGAAGLVMVLTGCSSGNKEPECKVNEEYRASTSIPELQIPEELDRPAERERLQIPNAAEDAPPVADKCLERPPDYFGRPL